MLQHQGVCGQSCPQPSLKDRRKHLQDYRMSSQRNKVCNMIPQNQCVSSKKGVVVACGISEEERAANEKRWKESGGGVGTADEWNWTLNWNKVLEDVAVGSCPRTTSDINRILKEAGCNAVLSLQCDDCLKALQIDFEELRNHGIQQQIPIVRIPMRDFDRNDQTLMLPEAVRMLALLLACGYKVYIHCTAGINRAPTTVIAYLTFVQGWSYQDAHDLVKGKRQQAHPYRECWKGARMRMVEGRAEEVMSIANNFYLTSSSEDNNADNHNNHMNGNPEQGNNGFDDWVRAEDVLIRQLFQRQLDAQLSFVSSQKDIQSHQLEGLICILPEELENARAESEVLRQQLQYELEVLSNTKQELEEIKKQIESVQNVCSIPQPETVNNPGESLACDLELQKAQQEIQELRAAIRDVAQRSLAAVRKAKNMIPEEKSL
eukprot:TRINITY_DN1845_c1_g1_i1.p1 TRINITY_DN1845_c1_g1~~TRINITY_DN1845_c1_g1_i1.p1  ORF type:complete len:457 (-),score=47.06 TRINITY_DN1845_c1_g1_i1:414-1712(-)